MQEHPLVELYITTNDDEQNNAIEQLLSSVNIDEVVLRTLQAVGISQQIMLTLLITDDAGIREMNTQYRQQDKPTDVLSFPLLEKPLVDAPSDQLWSVQNTDEQSGQETPDFVTPPDMITNLGDIVMSWPTLVRQAREAGHSSLYEILYLLSHGVLHLVGYDDHTEAGYKAMVSIQEAVLRATGQKV
ncbi:MAG: rRNA maturation RNase YbeY [Ktedonobacteraceae bacterium]|nr:rRNA maturation RNase YbeY [Ktedonobacteraceae bacterium]